MKTFNPLLSGSIVLCTSLFLSSCKKQILETIPNQSPVALQAVSANECKPAALGVYSFYTNSPDAGQWITLAQKWYADGKVKYLKAKHGGWTGMIIDPVHEFMFDFNWAEVTYHGNQVYLTDVVSDHMLMRVTLDNQGRPVASYYDYDPSPGTYIHDTTYYYYNGNQLDYMISLYKTLPYGINSFNDWRKYVFSYDAWGNVIKAEFPGKSRLNVQYDYTKPVTDIIGNIHLTSSLKLLEYMELIKLPMHHAVTRTNFEIFTNPYDPEYFYEYYHSEYKDYVITDGLVRSYEYDDPYRVVTFYNGWDCDNAASMDVSNKPGVANLKEFQQLYPSFINK